MAVSPIQTSFSAGELSERVQARLDAEVRRRGLSSCLNFEVLPQGPLRMRAGAQFIADLGDLGNPGYAPKLIPFRVAGSADDYCLALLDRELRIFSATTGAAVPLSPNFVAPLKAYWTTPGEGEILNGLISMQWALGGSPSWTEHLFNPNAGRTYTLSFVAWSSDASRGLSIDLYSSLAEYSGWPKAPALTRSPTRYTYTFVADSHIPARLKFSVTGPQNSTWVYIRDVSVSEDGLTATQSTSWDADAIQVLRWAAYPVGNQIVIVHPDIVPQIIGFDGKCWNVVPVEFKAQPDAWQAGNYPTTVEIGFQGRAWLANTRMQPSTVWFSKSGVPFDFTMGSNPGDAGSFIVSTKGSIQWLAGQKALIAGDDVGEHTIQGSSGIVTPSNLDVRDESAFGSAPVQGQHIGDQVLFVSRDRRHIRAMNYVFQENAWLSRAVTFLADHITEGEIKEVHFARSPYPCIVAAKSEDPFNRDLICCTYDRAEQVIGWWRVQIPFGDSTSPLQAACVLETDSGAEIWLTVFQLGSNTYLERIPLHEAGRQYLDSWVVATKVDDSHLSGFAHLAYRDVYVLMDGALLSASYRVAPDGSIAGTGEFTGTTFVVGVPFTATAKTLPREVKTGKARDVKVGVLLSDSALPLLNGKRPADRTPATPQDQPEPPRSGRFWLANLGWSDDGAVTIEQDLPFRTEILAIFAVTAAERI